MKFYFTALFEHSFSRLSALDKKRIKGALKKLARNPYAPYPNGMRVHKLKGVKGAALETGAKPPPVWEFHASLGLIITFQNENDVIVLRNCGQHDDVLDNP